MPDVPPAIAALSAVLNECWDWLLSLPEWAGVARAGLLRAGFAHWAMPVRRLCAEYAGKFPFAGAEDVLADAVAHADPVIVRRFALLALATLAPARAVAWAAGLLSPLHPDEYPVLASVDILAAHAPAALSPLAPALRQHPSAYVQLRVSPGGLPAGPHPLQ